jgi:Protein of unknown function (DUF2842)
MAAVSSRIKKLIATLLIILVWLPVYALFVMGLAVHVLPEAAWYVSLCFYALAGTLWILPIGLALPWMYREQG